VVEATCTQPAVTERRQLPKLSTFSFYGMLRPVLPLPQHQPDTRHSKLGFTSLLAVLFAFVLQMVYLPAHLALEEHHSLLGDCVKQQYDASDWHDHGDGKHRHEMPGFQEEPADTHQHLGGHEHDSDHDHGCQYFVQRLQPIQIRICQPLSLPSPAVAMVAMEGQGWAERKIESEIEWLSMPARIYGSRGPPLRV
jgi:hypothetical protein